jgi:(E)-4-hydroxy-3-methylbut-2-enyl-diphosphate synthase
LFQLVEKVEKAISNLKIAPKIAIMGCVVNGPGEAREADIGIAGGRGTGILFKKGKVIHKIPEEELADALIREVMHMAGLQK